MVGACERLTVSKKKTPGSNPSRYIQKAIDLQTLINLQNIFKVTYCNLSECILFVSQRKLQLCGFRSFLCYASGRIYNFYIENNITMNRFRGIFENILK